MHNENENYEGNNIIQFEDLFKDELKKKKHVDQPVQNKARYIFSILYYVLIMFLVAGIIQIVFISNPDNIDYLTKDEKVLNDLINDPYGIAIMDTDVYANDYMETYANYIDILGYYSTYTLLYNISNDLVQTDTLPDDLFANYIVDGTMTYWDEDMTQPFQFYVSDDDAIYTTINVDQLNLISLATPMFDEIIKDPNAIGLIDINFYDTYFSDYSQDLYVIQDVDYINYYIVANVNNVDLQTLIAHDETMWDLFSGNIQTWSDGSNIILYEYQNQVSPINNSTSENYYVIDYMDWDLTGYANGLVNFIIYIILLPVLLLILKPNLSYDVELTKKDSFSRMIGFIITGYVFLIVANLVSSIISDALSQLFNQPVEESVNQMAIVNILHSNGAIFMVISAVFIGPIVEELIFRKSIFGLIKNNVLALIVSSVIFGSIHLIGEASFISALINGIGYIIMGFVFGIIYIKNQKNIVYPMAVHILSNLISILGILFIT